jgi:hypothetical protein
LFEKRGERELFFQLLRQKEFTSVSSLSLTVFCLFKFNNSIIYVYQLKKIEIDIQYIWSMDTWTVMTDTLYDFKLVLKEQAF